MTALYWMVSWVDTGSKVKEVRGNRAAYGIKPRLRKYVEQQADAASGHRRPADFYFRVKAPSPLARYNMFTQSEGKTLINSGWTYVQVCVEVRRVVGEDNNGLLVLSTARFITAVQLWVIRTCMARCKHVRVCTCAARATRTECCIEWPCGMDAVRHGSQAR